MKKSIAFISTTLLATMLNAEQVKRVDFVNLSKVSTKIATETVDIKPGDELNIQKVNEVIKKFFSFGYFKDIVVKNNNGILEFHFKEKPTIANITMTGYKQREEDLEVLYKSIGIKRGALYTKKKMESVKKALHKELQKEGYVGSVVELITEDINENSVSVTIDVNKGEEIIIKKANYFGINEIDVSEVEKLTANNEEDIFPWLFGQNSGEVKLDQLPYEQARISDVYFQHGYLDSKVKKPFLKVDFSSNEAELNYFIEEGKQYGINNIVIYLDSTILDPKILYPDLKSKKGRVFNITKLRKDIEFIKTSVADLGYAFTVVNYKFNKDQKNSKVDLVFNVIPGKKVYINDVFISGNGRTLDRVIRRNVYLAPGDLFNLTDFKDSNNKLKRSGYFDTVEISQKRVSEDKMDLLVKVKEAPTGQITLGGGFGSYDGFSVTAGLNDKNVFGSGKTLGVDVETSKRSSDISIYLKEPSINDGKYDATFDIHNNTNEIEYSSKKYTLDKKVTGFTAGIGTELFRDTRVGMTYRLDKITETYHDDDLTDSYDPFVFKKNQDYILSSLTPYISFNNTNDYYFPTEGMKARTSLEYAGVGGDAKYIKSISNFSFFHTLEDRFELDWVFKYKASLKYLIDTGKISQGDSFYLGGTKSLRGYKSYAFGPDDDSSDPAMKQTISNSVELSFPLFSRKTRWAVFYDYGMIGEDNFSDIKRSSTGSLFEWISPMGPMQFIFAQALDAEDGDQTSSFEFSLGSSF